MSLLSFEFIGFVALVFFVSMFVKGNLRKLCLLCANIYFLLSFANSFHLIWLLLTGIVVYVFSIFLERKQTKLVLILAIVLTVGSLCFFKYSSYFNYENVIVPLGLSFYTFKMISYLADIYQKKLTKPSILNYLIYISFFPFFTAGPINRAKSFFEQLNAPYQFDYQRSKNGAVLCALGMFQKFVFANYLSIVCSSLLDNAELTGIYLVVGVILYSLYIYLDFDGYSNIAIGIANMLGIECERNFHTPYLASSISEFWDRWHISLSSWLKDYIYIPLGGNRKGTLRKYINLMIVFVISGLWHGSTVVFLVWGIGHGIVNIVENIISNLFKKKKFTLVIRLVGKLVGIIVNFTIVSVLWVFFRSSSMGEAMRVLTNMIPLNKITFDLSLVDLSHNEMIWICVICLTTLVTDVLRNKVDMIAWLSRRSFVLRWGLYITLIAVAILFGVYGPGYNASDFIYAEF